jgi:hypothetical protein
MKTISVLPLNSRVGLVGDDEAFLGSVRSITLHANGSVAYEVGWWSGRSFVTDHFYESELNSEATERQKIGFSL